MSSEMSQAYSASMSEILDAIHRLEPLRNGALIYALTNYVSRETKMYDQERLEQAMKELTPLGFQVVYNEPFYEWSYQEKHGRAENVVALFADALAAMLSN